MGGDFSSLLSNLRPRVFAASIHLVCEMGASTREKFNLCQECFADSISGMSTETVSFTVWNPAGEN